MTTPSLNTPTTFTMLERWLLRLETMPFYAIYRIAIGVALVEVQTRFWGVSSPVWSLPALLLATLGALRVAPALARKVLPFCAAARQVWAERRQTGKRYDCYQWQKLFWIGVGLAVPLALRESQDVSTTLTAALCIIAGGIGALRWRLVSARISGRAWPVHQEV